MKIKKLKLKKLNNTRDLGGITTTDDKVIKRGHLIRSGKLYNLPKSTIKKLNAYNIDAVLDLRSPTELKNRSDSILKNATYLQLPLQCTATPNILQDVSMRTLYTKEALKIPTEFATCDDYMLSMYKHLLTSDYSKSILSQVFQCFLKYDKVLWHCNGGKDRTGLVAILLEGVLGVSEDTIIEDYVISSKFRWVKNTINKFALSLTWLNKNFKDILKCMMTSKKEYVLFILDYIKREYGSITKYCKKELNLTDENIFELKNKFLE